MKRIFAVYMLVSFVAIACQREPVSSQVKSEVPSVPEVAVEKERAEEERPLPPEVKIKLKKDGKDNYSLPPNNFN